MRKLITIAGGTLLLLGPALGAQGLDSAWTSLSSRQAWRGYDLGRIGAVAGASFSLFGIGDKYTWQGALDVEGATASSERPPTRADTRVAALAKLVYSGNPGQRERAWLGVGANRLPGRATDANTMELVVGYEREIPWREERNPVAQLSVVQDLVRHKATLVESSLAFDYKFADVLTALATVGQSFTNLPAQMAPARTAFRPHASWFQLLVNAEPGFLRRRNFNITLQPSLDITYTAHSPEYFHTNHGLRVSFIH